MYTILANPTCIARSAYHKEASAPTVSHPPAFSAARHVVQQMMFDLLLTCSHAQPVSAPTRVASSSILSSTSWCSANDV